MTIIGRLWKKLKLRSTREGARWMQLHTQRIGNGASFQQKVPFELALKRCVGLDAEMDTLIQAEGVTCRASKKQKVGNCSLNRLCVLRVLSCLLLCWCVFFVDLELS